MSHYNKVKVYWTRPVHVDESSNVPCIGKYGVYMITRKYVRNDVTWEVLLYVGITTRSFYKRLSEHLHNESKWCSAYGKKYIRFGIVSMYNMDKFIPKKLLTDIETNIIHNLNQAYPDELINIQQVSSYNYNYNLNIRHFNNGWLTRFNQH